MSAPSSSTQPEAAPCASPRCPPPSHTTPRNPTMPTIRVELFEGRTVEQKRALAQALTEATVRTLGGSADGVDVVFFDIARQNWSTGG
ncbi:MAG: 4-oxalocrotonate tautomerase, partial [Rubrivivax sp.]